MFIGHMAVGLAGKKADPGVSLGVWILAAQWIDLLWPLFLLLGLEQVRIDPGNTPVTPFDFVHYPYTHSLLAVLGWSAGMYLFARFALKIRSGTAVLLGAAVLSHWVLDWLTHRPDLPLYPGGAERVGLGLWYSPLGTLLVEGALFAAGIWLYLRAKGKKPREAGWRFWAFIALLTVMYMGNMFGSPPPAGAEPLIGWLGLAQWLLVFLAFRVDRPGTSP